MNYHYQFSGLAGAGFDYSRWGPTVVGSLFEPGLGEHIGLAAPGVPVTKAMFFCLVR